MAHFDVHRNRGYDGGYGEKQPVYGGRYLPAAVIMGYTATSESYAASTEEVVTFSGDYPMTRPDLQERFWPRGATHIQPKQIDHDQYDNSPKLNHAQGSPRKAFDGAKSPSTGHYPNKYGEVLSHAKGSPHDSPRKAFDGAKSPPMGHYPNKYGEVLSHAKGSPHDSPRKAFDEAKSPPTGHYPNKYGEVLSNAKGSPHDSPRKAFDGAKSPPTGHYPNKYGGHLHDYDSPRSPRYNHANGSSPHDSPRKANFHPTKYSGPHDSPRKNFRDSRGAFSSNDDDSSDEEEVECRDGVCYPKPKYGGGQGYDHEDKKKGNGYAAGNYPLQQHSTDHHQPSKDPYRTIASSDGKSIYGSHSYNAPAHTKPTTDAYYDRYAAPAPIRTKPDHHDGGRFGGDNGKSSPVSAVAHWTPFAEGKSEMIDSTEAQRRYANAPVHSGRRYGAAIDSETAAKKYGGVFVRV